MQLLPLCRSAGFQPVSQFRSLPVVPEFTQWSSPSGVHPVECRCSLVLVVCVYVPEPVRSRLLLEDCCRPESLEGEAVEPLPEQGVSEVPAVRKPTKEATWLGPKESAVRQHRQEMKTKMKTNKVEEVKPARPKQTQCQQELDQVLERISKMPFRDNRGPLEDLYAMHIPNCDKRGQYNLKQCKMSLHGQRGECWCVNPHTGRPIPSSPTVRGDPNCSQYLPELELELPDTAQI
ncbi:insulin-like growth factor-binding protein 2-A isoform X2 [Platichthys flesus]|uniref:insulin-like growth factor-binding protein 2-A isoform X2 n=1 Tax=Platichthys flesus TaxID=8260 RepID=UPI002DB7ECCB|nr:insulin-like growth factor-binding protein 2-A isoform X2 [Platichthys flesus]